MAFVTVNGFDVQHASSLVVYENLFPKIQHINGKGCIDKYTKVDDIHDVTYIDVMRVLPYGPRFRKLGSSNNGKWHNSKNQGGTNNAAQSNKYTIPVDLLYDEGVPVLNSQEYSNPIALKAIVMAQVVQAASLSINVVTFAKQIEGYFRNGDNFDKALAHEKGSVVAADITATEIAKAAFGYSPDDVNTVTKAFIRANASLNNGIPEIGAFIVPPNERQAFITSDFDALMQGQYVQNASDAAARILATGFINPFNEQKLERIDPETGLCGTYAGVDMFLFYETVRMFVYVALGILGTEDDTRADLVACRTSLDKLSGLIVYGAGTCRGIVGPTVEVNKQPFQQGIFIVPGLKMGVEVLHGGTIKAIVNGSWTAEEIAKLVNTLEFTPIDGETVRGTNVVAGFNDGTSN